MHSAAMMAEVFMVNDIIVGEEIAMEIERSSLQWTQ